jgi:hypothetical protein
MVHRRGITVLEALVVLVAVILAVGLGIMLLMRIRNAAQNVQCSNNLRQLGKAFHSYHEASAADEKVQVLPPSRIADGYATWAVLLAPHLAKEHPLQQWDVQQTYFAQKPEVREATMFVFFCPSRERTGALSQAGDLDADKQFVPGAVGDYASVAGDGTAEENGALVSAAVERKDGRIVQWMSRTGFSSLPRGVSYTMLVGEKHVLSDHQGDAAFGDGSLYNGQHLACFSRYAGPGFPIAPTIDAPFNKNFGSPHNRICHFLMADGSYRAMSIDTSEVVLGRLAKRGE